MNTTLEAQLSSARPILTAAAEQQNPGLAKLAIGMMAGAIAAALPAERHHSILQAAEEAGRIASMDALFGIATWLAAQAPKAN